MVGDAFVVAGASGAAVSVAPPEQAETNMLRTRNPATQRFMPGVFHEGRVSLRESPVEHPCVSAILENHGRPTVTICAISCRPPSLNRQEDLKYQASRQSFVLWSWGESKHRNLSETSVWTASARGFNDVCLTGTPVSVWWCAFCAMKCATKAQVATVLRSHPSRRPRGLFTGRPEPGLFHTGRNPHHDDVADSG